MKRFFQILLLGLFVACNNSDHSEHADSSHTVPSPHGQSAERSMYSLMQDNMNQMMQVKSTGNPDADFAALMKIHHQGAVDMSQLQIEKGTNEEVKAIARQIIADQQKEIAVFDSIIAAEKAGTDTSFFHKSMEDMHHSTLKDERSNVDREFIEMMIPHHEGAIVMARTYRAGKGKNSRLKSIANNIIKTQQAEIDRFKQMLPAMK